MAMHAPDWQPPEVSRAAQPPVPAPAPEAPRVVVVQATKNAGLAAILSFFICGLGQFYNGQFFKGIMFFGMFAVSVVAMGMLVGFITTPIMWLWGMVDAYKTAEGMNRAAERRVLG